MFFIVSVCYSFVLNMLLNYAVFCVIVIYILHMSYALLIFLHFCDLSDLINILNDEVNVHSTDSTVGVDYVTVSVASTTSSSCCFPFTDFIFRKLFIISNIYSFVCMLLFWDS